MKKDIINGNQGDDIMKSKLLEVLRAYEIREFEETKHNTVEDIPTVINLAYTTTSSEKHEVQVNFDTEKLEWQEYIDNELKIVSKRNSLEEFINELSYASFDEIVSDILWMAEELEEES